MPINPFDQFDAPASRSGNPFDQFDGPALATPPKLTRSLGEKVKDTAIGIGQGTMQLGGALATLPDVLTGGAISEGVVKPFQRLADKALGGTGEDPAGLAGGLQTVQQMGDEQKSPVLRRKQQDLAATEGFLPSAAKVLTDPTLLGQFAAEQAPILATLGAGTAGTAAKAATGLTGDAAAIASKKAAERALTVSQPIMSAGFGAQQAQDQTLALDDATFAANPEYQALIAEGVDPQVAKEQLARRAGIAAAPIAAATSALASRLTAPLEAQIFTRALDRAPGIKGAAIQFGSGVAREAGQETIEEGGEQFAGNVGTSTVDPNQDLMAGVPEAAGAAAAVGGALGGATVGAGMFTRKAPEQPPPPAPPAPEVLASQAQPAAAPLATPPVAPVGPLTRAAATVAPTVAAPAPLSQPPAAAPQDKSTPAPSAADQQGPYGVLDPKTGELVPRTPPKQFEMPTATPTAAKGLPPATPDFEAKMQERKAAALTRAARPDPAAGPTSAAAATAFDSGAVATALQQAFNKEDTAAAAAAAAQEEQQQRAQVKAQKDQQQAQSLALKQRQIDASTYDEEDVRAVIGSMIDQGQRIDALSLAKRMGVKPRLVDQIRMQEQQARSKKRPTIEAGQEAPIDAEFTDVTGQATRALPPPDQRPAQIKAVRASESQLANRVAAQTSPRSPSADQGPTPVVAYDTSTDVLDDDVTTTDGTPFTVKGAAEAAARRTEGGKVIEVDGGYVVRTPKAAAVNDSSTAEQTIPVASTKRLGAPPAASTSTQVDVAPDVAGDKINKQWTAFAPDSGTLNIPRADMPQVKSEHRGAMVNYLNARGITHEQDTVAADSLKPTQGEFSPAKVKKAIERAAAAGADDRSILVSSDGHVLDGHHQWLAKREAGQPVKVIRLNAPIKDLLQQVKDFPSSTQAKGATATTDQKNAPQTVGDKASADIPRAKRRLREARNRGDAKAAAAAEKEIRELRAKAFDETPLVTTATAEPTAPPVDDVATMEEIDALKDVGTVDIMREATDALGGEAEFRRQAEAYIAKVTKNGKFNDNKELLIESFARSTVAKARRKPGNNQETSREEEQAARTKQDAATRQAAGEEKGLLKSATEDIKPKRDILSGRKFLPRNDAAIAVRDALGVTKKRAAEIVSGIKSEAKNLNGVTYNLKPGIVQADDVRSAIERERSASAPVTAANNQAQPSIHKGDWVTYPIDKDGNRRVGEVVKRTADTVTVINSDGVTSKIRRKDALYISKVTQASMWDEVIPPASKTEKESKREEEQTPRTKQDAATGQDASKEKGLLKSATAPEHIDVGAGVSVDELRQMASAFREYIDGGNDAEVTHVFDAPAKSDVVRLQDKVRVHVANKGWMTVDEAKKQIRTWEDHAVQQGKDSRAGKNANGQKIVLSLFDLSGEWSAPWEQAGYQVYRFDIQDESTYEDPSTGKKRKIGDVHNMSVEFFADLFGAFDGNDVHAVLAACPCTDFAVSGARHFAAKDADGRTVASVELVKKTMALIEYFKPAVWAVENPVGRIESLTGLPPWSLSFDPNHVGDPYTKKTLLWGRMNADLPIAPVEPTEGSKMHKLYGGKSMATKNARSVTPEGFAYAFFMANNAVDNPLMTLANKYDRLDGNAIKGALDAGLDEQAISDLVDHHYYQDLDDDAANKALRAAASIAAKPAPTAPVDAAANKAQALGTEESDNAARPLDTPSTPALAGTPAADVPAPEGNRKAGGKPAGGSRSNGKGNGAAAGGRVRPPRRVGNDPGTVPVSAGGAAAGDGSATDQPGVLDDASNAADAAAAGQPGLKAPEPPQFAGEDFTITDDLELGEGGQKTKYRRNVDAIKLLNTLESEGRNATADEQRTLALYVGWGSLSQVFDETNEKWAKEHTELKALLTPAEYETAEQSTQYAHFTSRSIVGGIYSALKHLGFTGGKMLEAGGGVGNFIGLMPADLRTSSRYTLVERERISAGIAKHLYPRQNVQMADFREFGRGDDGYYDVAAGNPPFGDVALTDLTGRKHLSGLTLHNYFIAKQIDMLRDGGILINVVTNSFLDAAGERARKYIGERAKLLGAIRLPNNAFKGNAGTEVTTDIVIFQKLPESEWGSRAASDDAKRWIGLTNMPSSNGGAPIQTNTYFAQNPHMMLGDWGRYGSMYAADSPALVAKPGQKLADALQAAVAKLPQGVFEAVASKRSASMVQALATKISNPPVSEGGYFVRDGKLIERLPNVAGEAYGRELTPDSQWTEKTKLGETGYNRLVQLADLRQTMRALLAAELNDDPAMDGLRAKLNQQYDAYAKDQLLHDQGTSRYFDDDPDYPLLLSLELDYKPGMSPAVAKKNGVKPFRATAKKAAIFTQRVVPVRKEVTKASTPEDALNISLAERGRIDAKYIGQLLGADPDGVLESMAEGADPLLFMDPATGEYTLRDEYLSGNVRKKLAQARESGMRDNARALERVLPEDVSAAEITVRLGAPWVPADVYEQFAKQLLGEGTSAKLAYVPFDSSFSGYIDSTSTAAYETYGTSDYPAQNIILSLLNNREIKVWRQDSEGKRFVDKEATENAQDKAKEIREKFSDWVMQDADRSSRLVRAYNDANNNYVTRRFDGSWLTYPGKVPDSIISLRKHQADFVARGLQTRTVLADHVVGSGKTFSAIALAMELKRTGLVNKNMIAVPNHLVKQWAADFYKLYPGANILAATKKDFERANRRRFLAKIASNDWDAVIIAHSSFGFIKPAPEFEQAFIDAEKKEIKDAINALKEQEGDSKRPSRKVKQMQATLERLDNRLKALRDKPMDDLLDLEQIGVDQLFVDEAHMFKNLMYSSKMQNVRGLGDPAGSQRAYDMLIKTRQIYARNGRGQGVVFLTGTPVSNSLAEMYHMMRYLMPDQLNDAGFRNFDAWANTYADISESLKPTTAGGYKSVTAFGSFNNTFELLKMFDQVSDTVTMEQVKAAYKADPKNKGREFPLPKLKTGRRQPVAMAMSPKQREYMDEIGRRAQALENRKGPPKKGEDNHLTLMSDARKAALDIRLVDLEVTKREPGARLDRAAGEIMARYKQWDAQKGTQLVFSDLGTPLKHAQKELKEYQDLSKQAAALTDEAVLRRAELGDESARALLEEAQKAQDKIDNAGRDWMDAIKAAERGFSVYDDLKAALVERGIPENEIAFIHDFNTDDQKAALFKRVNAGEVRVLMGSTPKMGAGTNVQERLVALHHLDIPWKPSDVEQREGRIVRQGNKLSETIEGFEVEILAYVTKDTLDKNMWDIQERKIRGINQLRTREISREIENSFDDMEMSASEMQAAATGNTDLLRRIQLDNDIKKLERRKRAHDALIADKKSRVQQAKNDVERLPARIAKDERIAELANKQMEQLRAKPFKVKIGAKTYTDRVEASTAVRDLIDERITDENGKEKPKPLSVVMDGAEYTNRTKFEDAFLNLRGDIDSFEWELNGEKINRRRQANNKVGEVIRESMAEGQTMRLGAIGPFEVTVEPRADSIDVVVEANGEEVDSFMVRVAKEANEWSAVAGQVTKQVFGQIQSPPRSDWDRQLLDSAKQLLSEVGEVESTPWPDQAELDAKREEYRELLRRIERQREQDMAVQAAHANARQSKANRPKVDPYDLSTEEARIEGEGGPARFAKASGPQKFSPATARAWKVLSEIPGVFQRPRTDAKSFEAISKAILPDAEVVEVEDGATITVQPIKDDNGKPKGKPKAVTMTILDGQLAMDASQLEEGVHRGSALYSIALTYAHNNGIVFIPDPADVSEAALQRRGEHMLSSALKFGTTRHMEPDPRQGLNWIEGDDQNNILELIRASADNVLDNIPDLQAVDYDWDSGQFLGASGRPFTSADFEALADSPPGRAARAGVSTLRRALVSRSLERRAGTPAWRTVVARLLQLGRAGLRGSQLEGVLYGRGEFAAGRGMPKAALERLFANAKVRLKADKGMDLVVLANASEFPAEIQSQPDFDETVQAAISGDRKTVYFVANAIKSPKEALKLASHELIGHYSMEEMLGPRLFRELSAQIIGLRDAGKWPELFAEVSKRYERNADGTFRALDEATFAAEAIAVFAERNVKTSFVQRALNAVRAWLRRFLPQLELSQGELRQMLWEAGQMLEGRPYRPDVAARALGQQAPPKNMREAAQRYAFGKPAAIVDSLQDLINPKDTTQLERLKDAAANWRPAALGALQLRHLGELAEDVLPQVAQYAGVVQRMATMRNELQEMGHQIVHDGLAYQGKHPEEAKRLFRMLHDATLAGVDPSMAHKPLQMLAHDYQSNVEVSEKTVKEFVKHMRAQALLNPGSAKVYVNRASEARKMLNQEKRRRASHREMSPKWAALSPEAKALWTEMREAYRTQSGEYEKALISRIESLDFDKAQKRANIARMRLQFEAARVPFYVPLARWGNYWVSGTSKAGQREFYMLENQAEQKRKIKELEATGYLDIGHGVKLDTVKAQDGASETFIGELNTMLKEKGAPEKIQDEIFQLYLRTLPDLSIRKNFIHRQGTPGYSQDAIRALAGHIFHGSFQIARLRYSHELEGIRADAQQMAKDLATAGDDDANAAGAIVNELKKRHQWVLNPMDNALTNKISSLGFVYYLGLTPAAALVNLLQTPMVAGPVLAGKHKVADVTRELWRAMKESIGTYGHMQKRLSGDELEAHAEFSRRGVFDKTQAHNIAGIAESDTHAYSPTWHKVMTVISHVFHKAEVVNREATAMAAYRLERAAGADHSEAIEAADRAVHESQFDYSNANRARFMQSGTAKVLLMFRQYSLAVTWLLGRNMYQAFKGADEATRTEARRKLAGILGMTALFSGTLGLPVVGTIGAVLNAAAAAFGDDDDEPWDWETEFRAFLRDMLGDKGAEAVLRGPVQAATGVGISQRVSMGDLWFREPDRELEGRAWSNYLFEQAAGPMGGLITNFFRGQQLMSEGQVWRGVETIMPKAIKDAMKSIRYGTEGVNNLRGDPVVEDLNVFEALAQISGFSPASVGNAYDLSRDIKNYEQHILSRRAHLMDAFALAWRLGDDEAKTAVIAKMRKFSTTYPELAITGESIKRSLTQRARASAMAENGVIVDKRIRARLERDLRQN